MFFPATIAQRSSDVMTQTNKPEGWTIWSFPPFSGHLSGIRLLNSKLWQIPHGGASLRVQMPHGGASERVQMANLWNKKTIIAYKLMYFYRTCSSNRFLTAKTATFSRTVHVLLFVISRSQVETIVQIFAHVGVEPHATFNFSVF